MIDHDLRNGQDAGESEPCIASHVVKDIELKLHSSV